MPRSCSSCPEPPIDFPVFTTRPDTLFGATFFVLAPEHPDLERLVEGTPMEERVREYVQHALKESVEERADTEREKTGVFTGRDVINPVNDEPIPVYVSDYVLMDYGTGAIMGVPAHDERDFEFAKKFGLPIRPVVEPAEGEAPADHAFVGHSEHERLINSGQFTGMPVQEATEAIIRWLEGEGQGRPAVSYRLRDWLVSRQRYWGAPIPIVYCEKCGMVPVPEDELPVLLPDIDGLRAEGQVAAGGERGVREHDVPDLRRPGAPRDRHDGHLRRLLLVLPALLRPGQRRGAVGRGRSSTTGCRSTSTSAAWSTRSCT